MTWHDMTWHEEGSKLYKSMASLNALDIRDQRYAKPWCLWTPLNALNLESKLLSCLTLPLAHPFTFFIKPILKSLVILAMWLALSGVNLFTNLTVFCFNSHHCNLSVIETGQQHKTNNHILRLFFQLTNRIPGIWKTKRAVVNFAKFGY